MRVGETTLVAAAARLRVPWHTAHRWVLTGVITGCQRGGRWYVEKKSVERKAKELQEVAAEAASTDSQRI